ncbi:g6411 [Coccomyxa elongata]
MLPPSLTLCSALLKECAEAGNLASLQRIIQVREGLGFDQDAYCFTARIAAAGKAGDAQAVRQAFEDACKQNDSTVAVCNAAIEALSRCGDVEGAISLYEEQMRSANIAPDIVTFNALIRSAGRSKRPDLGEKAMSWFSALCQLGLRPDKYTFSAFFNTAYHCRLTDGTFLLHILSEIAHHGVRLNSRIMFTFLQSAWGAQFTREQVVRVFAEVAAMRAQMQPDRSVFAALLIFADRQGVPEHALDVWEALQQDATTPDAYLFSALFSACAAGRTPDLLDLAAKAEADMHVRWSSQKSQPRHLQHKQDWLIAYNALLNLHAKSGEASAAEAVYQGMLHNGPKPDSISVNTLIAAHAHVGDSNAAFNRFREMSAMGLRPNQGTYGSLLHCCAQIGNHKSAARVMQMMRSAGIRPTVEAYTSLMDACVKANTPDSLAQAFQVFDDMQQESVAPTAVTYGCLLVACEQLGDVERAFRLYKQACDRGIVPTDECHNILINVCAATGRVDEALELVKELARSHRAMQAASLNSVARALAAHNVARALRMVSFMTTLGLPTYHDTTITLIGACARQHRAAEAEELYWGVRKRGMLVTRSAGSDLIVALCKAGWAGKALKVYRDMMASAWGSSTGAAKHLQPGSGQQKAAPLLQACSDACSKAPAASTHAGVHGHADAAHNGATGYCQSVNEHGGPDAVTGLPLQRQKALSHSKKQKGQPILIPHIAAVGALVGALARSGDLNTALELYAQVGRDKAGAERLTMMDRSMWQSLLETCCHTGRVATALQVFDDWKAHVSQMEEAGVELAQLPRLSNATLAFLESCCRGEHEWRVFDVCAAMRQQSERKRQATLARPRKLSHHFLDGEE